MSPTTSAANPGCDSTPDFVYAVSLMAALEEAAAQDGHADVLALLGMARAELTDFGQRRPAHYVDVPVGDLGSGLTALEQCLNALLAGSSVLQHSLRLEASRRLLCRATMG